MKKWALITALSLLLPLLAGVGFLLWQNNRTVDFPSRELISDSRTRALHWLKDNREKVLATNNPVVWWMLQESVRIVPDPDLTDMINEYRARHMSKAENRVWERLLNAQAVAPEVLPLIMHLPDYNLLFIYALTCDRRLGASEEIDRQLEPDYCEHQSINPACVTHQLMGLVFLGRFGCVDSRFDNAMLTELQEKLITQLSWDVRVIDVYIQRVLMLAVTGATDRIKPVWISRILSAQAVDNGWGDFDPLIPAGGERFIGFSNKGMALGRVNSGFHSTAQAVYLFSLLIKNSPEAAN